MAMRKAGSTSKARGPSLGFCARCVNPTPAVTIERLSFGVGSFDLPLCDKCADRFQDDMLRWSRLGTIVDDRQQTFRAPAREPEPVSRGTVVWSWLDVPQVVATVPGDDEVEDADEIPVVVRPRANRDLPLGHENWTFSLHALERLDQRAAAAEELRLIPITGEEVLWCAEHPESRRPSTDPERPECMVHVRGHIQVVVNPHEHRIVTVIDRRIRTDQEQELESA